MDHKVSQQINDIVGDNVKKLAQVFPSVVKDGEVDFEALKEELGDFQDVGSEKYEFTFVDETFNYAESAGYDSQTLSLIIHGDPQIYKYHDRDIYCRITADYKGKTITVRFKGTKIIGTKYKWSLENEDAFEVFKK